VPGAGAGNLQRLGMTCGTVTRELFAVAAKERNELKRNPARREGRVRSLGLRCKTAGRGACRTTAAQGLSLSGEHGNATARSKSTECGCRGMRRDAASPVTGRHCGFVQVE